MGKVYLVCGSRGSHSDYRDWVLKAFLDPQRAEEYRQAAENYLIEKGLLVKVEEDTKWGRRERWQLNEDWLWGDVEGSTKLGIVAKSNPYDPGKEECWEWSGFNGYTIAECELGE